MSRLDFNPHDFSAAAGAAVIPSGQYEAAIIDSAKRPARSGDGDFVQLCLQVISGEYRHRVVWVRLHVGSSNETISRMAKEELAAICRAAGVDRLKDSSQLHHKPMLISAATALLKFSRESIELDDLASRVDELERSLGDAKGGSAYARAMRNGAFRDDIGDGRGG